MKLKDVLKYFDMIQKVKIWIVEDLSDDEPFFEGCAYDVPFGVIDCKMVTSKELEDKYNIDGGIRTYQDIIHLYIHG